MPFRASVKNERPTSRRKIQVCTAQNTKGTTTSERKSVQYAYRVVGIWYLQFCWVGNHINITMKPTNSPTQGQPNPRKIRLNMAFGPLFPTANDFWWLGLITYIGNRLETQPNKNFSANTLILWGTRVPNLTMLAMPGLVLLLRCILCVSY